jgi:lipopolysaccharide biosynthesis glycosyltransferase
LSSKYNHTIFTATTNSINDSPLIIHYAGDMKPWNVPNAWNYGEFLKYAKMTDFYNEIMYGLVLNGIKETKINIVAMNKRMIKIKASILYLFILVIAFNLYFLIFK